MWFDSCCNRRTRAPTSPSRQARCTGKRLTNTSSPEKRASSPPDMSELREGKQKRLSPPHRSHGAHWRSSNTKEEPSSLAGRKTRTGARLTATSRVFGAVCAKKRPGTGPQSFDSHHWWASLCVQYIQKHWWCGTKQLKPLSVDSETFLS